MFKTFLRILSALSITTISLTLGAGFAQAQEDRIKKCTGDESYQCSANEQVCAANPFSPMFENGEACGDVLRSHYRTAVVRFCGKPANKDAPECDSVLNKPNAANWSHNALEGTVDVLNVTNLKNQFLLGKESGLLTNRTVVLGYTRMDFGNSIHGLSYSYTTKNDEKYFYAGILSGTDLGGLVTEVAGLAMWSGTFGATGDNHVLPSGDFKLTVDFGNKKLTAFIDRSFGTVPSSEGGLHFSIDGRFGGSESGGADTGLITGKVELRRFLMNEETQPMGVGVIESATLSGLIGTDGVVGVFVSDDDGDGSSTQRTYGHFSGGFIATPPSEEEKEDLLNNCGTDPFNSVCFSDATYNEKREAKCLTNPNLPGCIVTVARVCEVEENPFNELCKEEYEPARVARVELCDDDTGNRLCGDKFADKICAYDPFSAICFNGGASPEDRAKKITLCEAANSDDLSCNNARKRPNVVNWINSFAEAETALSSDRDTTSPKNQFLKATFKGLEPQGTKRFNRFNYPAIVSNLNMSTATFGGTALGGDVKNGVSFFRGWDSTHGKYLHYAAVWTGTDLGAPVSGTIGKAAWVGHFETAGFYAVSQTDFILEVNFDSGSSGSIKAFVPYSGDQFFSLDGTFDASGLIEGTSELAYFRNQNRELKDESKASNTGLLRGLIGSNGALGVFRSDEIGALNGKHAYSGGFVARVNDNINHILTVLDACDTNPFGPLCNLDYETERADTINLCIEGDTMLASPDICRHAVARHPCIENPFAEECVTDFAQYYKTAKAKRVAFCDRNSTGSSIHPHCVIGLQPNAATWVNSFGDTRPPSVPDAVTLRNQFLQGTEDGLDEGDVNTLYQRTLNLNTTTFDGLALGGDVADGVAYFRSYRYSNTTFYAGIFSGTDLGAPLVETTTGGKFYGKIQWIYRYSSGHKVDFVLDIDFSEGDTERSAGTVEAFVYYSASQYLLLKGDFNRSGVISGTVAYGSFGNHDRDDTSGAAGREILTLTGLIGAEGAVGVFSGENYYGGFVAVPEDVVPFDPNVKYSDWLRSFDDKPPRPYAPSNDTQQARFLQGKRTILYTLPLTNTTPQTLTLADVRAGEDLAADGVDYVSGTRRYGAQKRHHYAGILSGTHLGAVLDASVEANWRGELGMLVNGIKVDTRDIVLNINFRNKRISHSSAVNRAHFVDLSANWATGGNNDGVLKGTITYNSGAVSNPATNSAGKVTGLIGQKGAVGAFISTHGVNHDGTNTPYAGGFVAVPSTVYAQTVGFSDWVRSLGNPHRLPTSVPYNGEIPQTLFVRGRETDLSKSFLRDVVRPANPLTLADVRTDGEVADGVSYMSGTQKRWNHYKTTTYHVAGILSGTHLGAPLEVKPAVNGRDATANWAGKLGMIVNNTTPVESSITLKVNYTDQNITLNRTAIGLGAVSFTNVGWDNTSGVYSGVITYDPNDSALANSTGKVTGLIGQQGAVGAFISDHGRYHRDNNTPYAGGFVARPPR